MHNHRSGLQPQTPQMWMPGDDVQEIAESYPEETLQVAELRVRFVVEVKSLLPGERERVDVCRLGHDVAELAP